MSVSASCVVSGRVCSAATYAVAATGQICSKAACAVPRGVRPTAACAARVLSVYKSLCFISSLGRYVFGSEISYNKAPPRLPGLGC